MDWMFQSRSNSYYDEDPDEGSYSSPTPMYVWLLSPILVVLYMFWLVIVSILMLAGSILYDSYGAAKRAYESGELEFPGAVYAGIILAVILMALVKNYSLNLLDHLFITLYGSAFILLCSVAPLSGLALRFFNQFITSLEKLHTITLWLLFLAAVFAVTLFYLEP